MSVSNGKITAPVSIYDLQQVLGESASDLQTLFASSNINRMAKWKPVRVNSYGLAALADRPFPRLTAVELSGVKYGLKIPEDEYISTLVNDTTPWEYVAFNGSGSSHDWARISDFLNPADNYGLASHPAGYNHYAVPPIRFTFPAASDVKSNKEYDAYATEDVGAPNIHIPISIQWNIGSDSRWDSETCLSVTDILDLNGDKYYPAVVVRCTSGSNSDLFVKTTPSDLLTYLNAGIYGYGMDIPVGRLVGSSGTNYATLSSSWMMEVFLCLLVRASSEGAIENISNSTSGLKCVKLQYTAGVDRSTYAVTIVPNPTLSIGFSSSSITSHSSISLVPSVTLSSSRSSSTVFNITGVRVVHGSVVTEYNLTMSRSVTIAAGSTTPSGTITPITNAGITGQPTLYAGDVVMPIIGTTPSGVEVNISSITLT